MLSRGKVIKNNMPKFLLHTCCAPCSIAVIDELKNKVDPSTGQRTSLTVFFYNPNIYPEEEYLKRKAEVVRVCEEWGVKMIDFDYEQKEWNDTVQGLEGEPEGGARCAQCFKLRLERTAQYARENDYEIFCTTLTSGRNKKAEVINQIGKILREKSGVRFFEADWKKEGRQEKARKMIEERGIYRQNYCGCKYSLNSTDDFVRR